MLDVDGKVLYVGKARNLRRRVDSYARPNLEPRIARMVERTASMEVVATRTENEALLLEQSLVRSLKPTTNIRLREGRGFPGLLLTTSHAFPRVASHRGRPASGDRLFGPFADGRTVERAVRDVERLFRLRSCDDATFTGRTRPCLNHQIGRCSAPCVGKVTAEDYAAQVAQATAFLEGRKGEARTMLEQRMMDAAQEERFEEAAVLRDRIHAIAQMGESQGVAGIPGESLDAIALAMDGPRAIVVALFARRGALQGHREISVDTAGCEDPGTILDTVLPDVYAQLEPPERILLSHALPADGWSAGAIAAKAGKEIPIGDKTNGARKRLMDTAIHAAREALARKLREHSSWKADFAKLGVALGLDAPPKRVEIFDNSHLSGTDALGVAVVATDEGFLPSHYRTYKFDAVSGVAGNDVGMMETMMLRRFRKLAEGAPRPDLLLIDGGPTQLAAVTKALTALGVADIPRVGVAKGEFRDHGLETLHFPDGRVLDLPRQDPALYCIQRLRDEAHRFAIGTQRNARAKRITKGPLDGIAGLGPARKRALIARFGSQKAASTASFDELAAVAGVGPDIARRIRDALD
jgi:excinuclease ABC subunit C